MFCLLAVVLPWTVTSPRSRTIDDASCSFIIFTALLGRNIQLVLRPECRLSQRRLDATERRSNVRDGRSVTYVTAYNYVNNTTAEFLAAASNQWRHRYDQRFVNITLNTNYLASANVRAPLQPQWRQCASSWQRKHIHQGAMATRDWSIGNRLSKVATSSLIKMHGRVSAPNACFTLAHALMKRNMI